MRKTTLVVMAAGIGSRFGGGIKQLEPVGPSGEIIMDYSVYDAIQAGFDKVVFIIRKDLEKDFREIIGNRMEKIVETAYAFQELDDLPAGFQRPEGRTKPWGTGQAILCCKDLVQEPFAVINADDYYGKEAFVKVHDYLAGEHPACGKMDFCMAGFQLGNTLSENGGVTRGICSVNEDGHLTKVTETKNIVKTPEGAAVKGEDGRLTSVAADCPVSMNMWGFTPEIFEVGWSVRPLPFHCTTLAMSCPAPRLAASVLGLLYSNRGGNTASRQAQQGDHCELWIACSPRPPACQKDFFDKLIFLPDAVFSRLGEKCHGCYYKIFFKNAPV